MDNGQNGLGGQPATFGGNQPVMGGNAQPFAPSPAPMSSENNDIILQPEKNNRSKKWPVIVIASILVIAAAVWALASWRRSTQSSFNAEQQYINYIISGNTDDNIGDEYEANRNYYLSEVFYNGDDNSFFDFCETAKKLLARIKNYTEDAETIAMVDEQIALLDLYKVYRELAFYNGAELSTIYVEGNYSETREKIAQKLNGLDGNASSYIGEYAVEMSKFVDSVADVINIYYEAGCTGDTAEELSACELPEEYESRYLTTIEGSVFLYDEIGYTVSSSLDRYIDLAYATAGYGPTSEVDESE